ncbi:MAG TPA: hypothetical protein VNG89_04320, partial [Vicinamibacterales bacterium]|nr:hypothetical protein [Vicinamibacterales bacterium]
ACCAITAAPAASSIPTVTPVRRIMCLQQDLREVPRVTTDGPPSAATVRSGSPEGLRYFTLEFLELVSQLRS